MSRDLSDKEIREELMAGYVDRIEELEDLPPTPEILERIEILQRQVEDLYPEVD